MTKTKLLQIRVEKSEHDDWASKAVVAGLSLSAWIRQQCSSPAEPPATTALRAQPIIARISAKWICKCGTKNIGVPVCGKCREPMPVNDDGLSF